MLSVLIVLLVSCAVALSSWHILRPKGVSVTEEFKARYTPENKSRKAFYTFIGITACALGIYGVTGHINLMFLALPGGIIVAKIIENRQRKARLDLLRTQYAQALNVLTSALQGGLSPYQALEDAVPSMPRPAKDVFIEILRRTRTGSTFDHAAESVASESGWRDLKSLVISLKLYSKTGCNLVEVFKHLLGTVYERENDRRYIEAVTSETRMTAMLLSFLPFGLMGVARIMAPDFMEPLFSTVAGNIVIILCASMVLTGNYIAGRMIRSVTGDV